MTDIQWIHHLDEAQNLAISDRKPLLIDIYSPTCYGCAKMKAETFPDLAVSHFFNTHFVCVKLSSKADHADIARIVAPYKLSWMPLFIFRDWRLNEVRRTSGFLPAQNFIAEGMFALGMVEHIHQNYDQAAAWFDRIAATCPRSALAAEALYWSGISTYYGANQDLDVLAGKWAVLAAQYPDSLWQQRADILAYDPANIFTEYHAEHG